MFLNDVFSLIFFFCRLAIFSILWQPENIFLLISGRFISFELKFWVVTPRHAVVLLPVTLLIVLLFPFIFFTTIWFFFTAVFICIFTATLPIVLLFLLIFLNFFLYFFTAAFFYAFLLVLLIDILYSFDLNLLFHFFSLTALEGNRLTFSFIFKLLNLIL